MTQSISTPANADVKLNLAGIAATTVIRVYRTDNQSTVEAYTHTTDDEATLTDFILGVAELYANNWFLDYDENPERKSVTLTGKLESSEDKFGIEVMSSSVTQSRFYKR